MHNSSSNSCAATPAPAERAKLVIGSGEIKSEGGSTDPIDQTGWALFQACNTSVIMMGGQSDGCLPTVSGTEPRDSTLCNGYLNLTGNAHTDWSAPDLKGAERTQADQDDLEDLAFWTENHQVNSILGGGGITLAGVFVLPNANPFEIGGNGAQDVKDSQYFTRKLEAHGGGTLEMKPSPYNMTNFPYFGGYALVR
jgi:hypothetical protein